MNECMEPPLSRCGVCSDVAALCEKMATVTQSHPQSDALSYCIKRYSRATTLVSHQLVNSHDCTQTSTCAICTSIRNIRRQLCRCVTFNNVVLASVEASSLHPDRTTSSCVLYRVSQGSVHGLGHVSDGERLVHTTFIDRSEYSLIVHTQRSSSSRGAPFSPYPPTITPIEPGRAGFHIRPCSPWCS
jgi:hypothetical protein